jgi:hypothetical protein
MQDDRILRLERLLDVKQNTQDVMDKDLERSKRESWHTIRRTAWLQLQRGNFDVAKTLYEETLKRDNSNPLVRAHYAITLLNRKQDDGSWEKGAKKLLEEFNMMRVSDFLKGMNKGITRDMIQSDPTKVVSLIVQARREKKETDSWMLESLSGQSGATVTIIK